MRANHMCDHVLALRPLRALRRIVEPLGNVVGGAAGRVGNLSGEDRRRHRLRLPPRIRLGTLGVQDGGKVRPVIEAGVLRSLPAHRLDRSPVPPRGVLAVYDGPRNGGVVGRRKAPRLPEDAPGERRAFVIALETPGVAWEYVN